MPITDYARKLLRQELVFHAGTLSVNGSETTKNNIGTLKVPMGGRLIEFYACYGVETGTSPSAVLTLERGTTVLATITVDTANTLVSSGVLDIPVQPGEELNVKCDVNNTDNTFDGFRICAVTKLADTDD